MKLKSQSVKDRLLKSWKTTLIGLTLIVSAIVSVFTAGTTWSDSIVPITLGLGFVLSKDEWVNKVIK
jgi:hypothetical protein